jgi:aerobic-type carbon monoxide dehydrogenase small subunit (CoxS/CutS family)
MMEIQRDVKVTIRVNGAVVSATVQAADSLLDFLRNQARATDVKCGCNQGDCGTCTVIYDGKAVKSCLILAAGADGKEVRSLKGLLDDPLMQSLQTAFMECGAVQCGFCTPGMLMASWSLLQSNPNPTRGEMRQGISGNLCRCTGYKKILDAITLTAAQHVAEHVAPGCQAAAGYQAADRLDGQARAKADYLLLGGG